MATSLRRGLARLIEPYVLFPTFALLGLCGLWGATYLLLRAERSNVERAALASTRELAESFGVTGWRANSAAELGTLTKKAIDLDRPVLIHVPVDRAAEVSPWKYLMPAPAK